MEFAQLQADGTALQITSAAPIEWDANNYCTAEALWRDGKAEQFGVVPLTVTDQPAYNADTQRCFRDGCELVDGEWRYKWTIEGLTPEQIAVNEAAKAARIQQEIVSATQARLDAFARTRNYDGILSACTYATDPNPKFASEGQYCVEARSSTWATLYTIMDEVTTGARPMPSGFADIEPLLPVLSWPL